MVTETTPGSSSFGTPLCAVRRIPYQLSREKFWKFSHRARSFYSFNTKDLRSLIPPKSGHFFQLDPPVIALLSSAPGGNHHGERSEMECPARILVRAVLGREEDHAAEGRRGAQRLE